MPRFNVADAKAHLSELIQKALLGEEVVIARDNRPMVLLVPVQTPRTGRKPGSARGRVRIAPEFDEPVPDFPEAD